MLKIARFPHPLHLCSSLTTAAPLAEHHKRSLSHPCSPSSHHPQQGLLQCSKQRKGICTQGGEQNPHFCHKAFLQVCYLNSDKQKRDPSFSYSCGGSDLILTDLQRYRSVVLVVHSTRISRACAVPSHSKMFFYPNLTNICC